MKITSTLLLAVLAFQHHSAGLPTPETPLATTQLNVTRDFDFRTDGLHSFDRRWPPDVPEMIPPGGKPSWDPKDKIEFDKTLNCYHFPTGVRGSKVSFRKCYEKDLPCNAMWRRDVRIWRKGCGSKPPLWFGCRRLWEPDVLSPEYCGIDGNVEEDAHGNRVQRCEPQGIGDGAVCPSPSMTEVCPQDYNGVCQPLEPDYKSHDVSCNRVWSKCSATFFKVCQGDALPCQDKCDQGSHCVRGTP